MCQPHPAAYAVVAATAGTAARTFPRAVERWRPDHGHRRRCCLHLSRHEPGAVLPTPRACLGFKKGTMMSVVVVVVVISTPLLVVSRNNFSLKQGCSAIHKSAFQYTRSPGKRQYNITTFSTKFAADSRSMKREINLTLLISMPCRRIACFCRGRSSTWNLHYTWYIRRVYLLHVSCTNV